MILFDGNQLLSELRALNSVGRSTVIRLPSGDLWYGHPAPFDDAANSPRDVIGELQHLKQEAT